MVRAQIRDNSLRICIAAFRGGPILDEKLPAMISVFRTISRRSIYTITRGRLKRKLFPFHGSINLCREFLNIRNEVDVLVCYATDHFPLPLLAHLLGKKVILFKGGFTIDELSTLIQSINCPSNSESPKATIFRTIARLIRRVSYAAFDKIVLVSSNLNKDPDLQKLEKKLEVARFFPGPHFYQDFHVKKKLEERDTIVGYIGRLERIKGINEFVKAIPIVVSQRKDIQFVIIGDGELRTEIRLQLSEYTDKNVNIIGNVSRSEIPEYLNNLKLVILPSFYEGLPTILLEAMACGTPVLATDVGAVPDLVINEKTGFLLKSNSPECIANSILRVLEDPKIYDISKNARVYVVQNYDYASTISSWKDIFANLYV